MMITVCDIMKVMINDAIMMNKGWMCLNLIQAMGQMYLSRLVYSFSEEFIRRELWVFPSRGGVLALSWSLIIVSMSY